MLDLEKTEQFIKALEENNYVEKSI